MHQPIMLSKAFLMLLLFIILTGILSVSAYPISQPDSGALAHILSSAQKQGSTPTPTLLPRDHEPVPSETAKPRVSDLPSTVEGKEVESDAEPSETSVSSDEKSSEEGDGEEEDSGHSGLNPNAIAGIAVGVGFGVLLLIAAFMYAFRVGWEKGQRQKEKSEVTEEKKQPPPPTLEPWSQVDVIRPPELVLRTGSSCWDSRSWSFCDEHTENYHITGERYSFRPGKGVYEIRDPAVEDSRGAWSPGRADSGLGLEYPENVKGKGREQPTDQ